MCMHVSITIEPFPTDRGPRAFTVGVVRGGGSGVVFGGIDGFAEVETLFWGAGVDLQRIESLLYRSLFIHRGTVDVRSCGWEVMRRSMMRF
jgi:hypothetical protein